MNDTSRYGMILVFLALVMAIVTSGCTSPNSPNSGNPGSGAAVTSSDSSGYSSSYADIQGTYTAVENPTMYITINLDGSVEINAGSGKVSTIVYMENGDLKIGDGTKIGDYPIQQGTLLYQGMTFRK